MTSTTSPLVPVIQLDPLPLGQLKSYSFSPLIQACRKKREPRKITTKDGVIELMMKRISKQTRNTTATGTLLDNMNVLVTNGLDNLKGQNSKYFKEYIPDLSKDPNDEIIKLQNNVTSGGNVCHKYNPIYHFQCNLCFIDFNAKRQTTMDKIKVFVEELLGSQSPTASKNSPRNKVLKEE